MRKGRMKGEMYILFLYNKINKTPQTKSVWVFKYMNVLK